MHCKQLTFKVKFSFTETSTILKYNIKSMQIKGWVRLVGFYGISTLGGNLMPNPY